MQIHQLKIEKEIVSCDDHLGVGIRAKCLDGMDTLIGGCIAADKASFLGLGPINMANSSFR